jgi:hypothetical protein
MQLQWVVMATLLGSCVDVSAQGLGAAAQKEKEKRAAKAQESKPDTDAPKVVTKEDLEASRPPEAAKPSERTAPGSSAPPSGRAAQPPTSGAALPGTANVFGGQSGASTSRGSSVVPSTGVADDSATRARQEKAWRARAASARSRVTLAEKELAAAERAAASLTIAPDTRGTSDPARQFGTWQSNKSGADQRLARARAGLELAKKGVEQLEEEARRAGVPPGWLR